MEELKLSDDVIEQIKDFDNKELTDEQSFWCQSCIVKYCQQNFKNWTSGNNEVDKFIQKSQLNAKNGNGILEWIEYDRFENVEYLTKGGFGSIYKAIWKDGYIVSLDFENNQWKRDKYCWGFSRQHLNNNFNSLSWSEKIRILLDIANSGNILNYDKSVAQITDLGLCRPVNTKSSQDEYKNIYGVLPYVAPEVLRGKEYTKESDIYGLELLHMKPKSDYKFPQFILDIIKQCLDADPLKRPKANELSDLLKKLYNELNLSDDDHEINKQIREANKINEKLTTTSSLYTSTTLSYNTNDDNSFGEYSESIDLIDFTKLNIDKSN
ncbi:hypothetical protein RclHR1_11100001 [Rhizophagus clarus]|uniref:Protein kinase domain-containing protein n=1 Tax=Rhizophagus clarus TaxID=94130 RepID=A0A2Z6Q3D3_9GLOM|nr:hypothetical protein RclHR1_11100001 [Rhizophagus clarus]